MKRVFVVYCHPSDDSFTAKIRDGFLRGLNDAGHGYTVSDLYAMRFRGEMSEAEYRREAFYRRELPVPADVRAEQEKINDSDAVAFIAPVFWSDVPAKLKGWFDRVWTYGFAYGENRTMKTLERGVFLLSAGNSLEYFKETGIGRAMENVLIRDRLYDRVTSAELIIFDETSRETDARELASARHLEKAYAAGRDFFEGK